MADSLTAITNETIDVIKRRFRGDITFFKTVAEIFFETLDENVHAIQQAVVDKDVSKIKFLCHYVKGGALNLGAFKLSKLLEIIESQPNSETTTTIIQSLAELKQESIRFKAYCRMLTSQDCID